MCCVHAGCCCFCGRGRGPIQTAISYVANCPLTEPYRIYLITAECNQASKRGDGHGDARGQPSSTATPNRYVIYKPLPPRCACWLPWPLCLGVVCQSAACFSQQLNLMSVFKYCGAVRGATRDPAAAVCSARPSVLTVVAMLMCPSVLTAVAMLMCC